MKNKPIISIMMYDTVLGMNACRILTKIIGKKNAARLIINCSPLLEGAVVLKFKVLSSVPIALTKTPSIGAIAPLPVSSSVFSKFVL